MKKTLLAMSLMFVLISLGINGIAVAASQNDAGTFYKGANLSIIVPYQPGGSYDLWARALAPHLQKHTGAKVIVENMPGAAGLVGGAYLYSIAKPDGLTIGLFAVPGMTVAEMLDLETVKYELDKFTYIGRVEVEDRALFVSKASGFKSLRDMQKSPKVIRFGTLETTSQSAIDASIISEAFGLKGKIIAGFKGGKEIILSLTTGRELDAAELTLIGNDEYAKRGELAIVAMMGKKRSPDFPDVPLLMEMPGIKPEAKKLLEFTGLIADAGRMVLAPPKVSETRKLFLEKALAASLKEPALLDWARKANLRIDYLPGAGCRELITRITEIVPKAERAKLKHITTQKYFN